MSKRFVFQTLLIVLMMSLVGCMPMTMPEGEVATEAESDMADHGDMADDDMAEHDDMTDDDMADHGDMMGDHETQIAVPFSAIDVPCPGGNVILSDAPEIAGSVAYKMSMSEGEQFFETAATFSPEAFPDGGWDAPAKGLFKEEDGADFVLLHRGVGTGDLEGNKIIFVSSPAEEQESLPCETDGLVVQFNGYILLSEESALWDMDDNMDMADKDMADNMADDGMSDDGMSDDDMADDDMADDGMADDGMADDDMADDGMGDGDMDMDNDMEVFMAFEFTGIDVPCGENNILVTDEPLMAGVSNYAFKKDPDSKLNYSMGATYSPEAFPDGGWDAPGDGTFLVSGLSFLVHQGVGTGSLEGGRAIFSITEEGVDQEQEGLPCEPQGLVVQLDGIVMMPLTDDMMGDDMMGDGMMGDGMMGDGMMGDDMMGDDMMGDGEMAELTMDEDASEAMVLESGAVVHIYEMDSATIHAYTGAAAANGTYIIESANSLVIVDAQLEIPAAEEFRTYIDSLEKPIERVIITHDHLDHWAGLGAAFEDAAVYSSAGTQAAVNENGPGQLAGSGAMMGASDNFVEIGNILPEGSETIDGIAYEYRIYSDAEASEQVVILLPELGAAMTGDLIYNDWYLILSQDFDNWISYLEELQAMEEYALILPGHGLPGGAEVIADSLDYLQTAQGIYDTTEGPDDFQAKMMEAYPDRAGDFFWGMILGRLYPEE